MTNAVEILQKIQITYRILLHHSILSSVLLLLEQTPCSAFKVQSVCLVQMLALLEEMYYELGLVG